MSEARILVVDDNPATRYTTSRMLKAVGFEVVAAATGGEGLRQAGQAVDLVILDVNLPDIDGFEVARRLRADPATARLPIIHLSATLVSNLHKAQGLEAGSDSYLEHPVEPPVLVGTVRAFLRARRAEEAVRASEARFRGVFDHALNGILLVRTDGICLEANPAMCSMLGRTREQVVGHLSSALFAPGQELLAEQVRAAVAASGSWAGYFPMLRGDGSVVELEWRISRPPGLDVQVAIAVDVSERRRLERERELVFERERVARSAAERANRIKDEFLATLSHELRNPLNAIVGWAGVLLHSAVPPQFVQAVQAIERNARMQAQLINDLLDVSRITSGKMSLELDAVELEPVLAAAFQDLQPVALARGVQIERLGNGAGLHVNGDAVRLHQVAWNLLSNAVKFTPAGGRVVASLEQVDGRVRLTVADTGKGISAEFLPHIFERFRQEQSTTRKAYGGLGLGLAIVQHIVAMHGGSIHAESAGEDRGSRFVVQLPLAAQPHAGSGGSLPAGAPVRFDGLRVLVVDDDADARALMGRLLRDAGAVVVEAESMDEALARIEADLPQVLVSDIGMAGQDGYDLMRRVRQSWSAAVLPAIAVTAFARPEDRVDALRAGFQEHLTKPVDPRRLLAAVRQVSSD